MMLFCCCCCCCCCCCPTLSRKTARRTAMLARSSSDDEADEITTIRLVAGYHSFLCDKIQLINSIQFANMPNPQPISPQSRRPQSRSREIPRGQRIYPDQGRPLRSILPQGLARQERDQGDSRQRCRSQAEITSQKDYQSYRGSYYWVCHSVFPLGQECACRELHAPAHHHSWLQYYISRKFPTNSSSHSPASKNLSQKTDV
jgi:hypothetical protein